MRLLWVIGLVAACGPGSRAGLSAPAPQGFSAFDARGRQVEVTQRGAALDPVTGARVWQLTVFDSHADLATDFVLTLESEGEGRRLTVATAGHPRLATLTTTPGFGVWLEVEGLPSAPAARGPFVLDAAALAVEPSPYLLLDAQVLEQLRLPDGSRPRWDTFRFRADLLALTPAQRTAFGYLTGAWVFEGDPVENWHRHGEVNHAVALQDPDPDPQQDPHNTRYAFGGFFNGHHAYLAQLEARWVEVGDGLPFRRTPSWDPSTRIPGELTQLIRLPQVRALPIPEALASGPAFCARFPTPQSLFDALTFWHDLNHQLIGGTFAQLHDSAQAPIFWPWHTTLDVLWMNWEQCQQ